MGFAGSRERVEKTEYSVPIEYGDLGACLKGLPILKKPKAGDPPVSGFAFGRRNGAQALTVIGRFLRGPARAYSPMNSGRGAEGFLRSPLNSRSRGMQKRKKNPTIQKVSR